MPQPSQPSGDRPVLITDAAESPAAEYERRRRRYGAMMAGRVVCVIAAFVVGTLLHNVLLAFACIVGAAVLPWAAVLIANDRLPKRERARLQAHGGEPSSAPVLTTGPSGPTGPTGPAGERAAGDRPPRIIEG